MQGILTFITGVSLTIAASLCVIFYLQESLVDMLSELCGTRKRAIFWRDIFNVSVLLVPALIAANYLPSSLARSSAFWESVTSLKWGLFGLSMIVALLAFVLNWHLGNARNDGKRRV